LTRSIFVFRRCAKGISSERSGHCRSE